MHFAAHGLTELVQPPESRRLRDKEEDDQPGIGKASRPPSKAEVFREAVLALKG